MSQVYRHTAGFLRPLVFQYTCSNFGICPLLLLSHIPVANFIASAKYTSRDSREYLWGFISCVSKRNTHKRHIFTLFKSAVSPKETHISATFLPVIHIYSYTYLYNNICPTSHISVANFIASAKYTLYKIKLFFIQLIIHYFYVKYKFIQI